MQRQPYNTPISRRSIPLFLTLALFLTTVSLAHAATLSVVPTQSSVAAGNIFTAKLIVDTTGSSINNADAVIQFPKDLLEVISVDKTSSIFTLWVEDPKFSNIDGKISLNGGVPNPGYSGSSGQIISATFRAKSQGTASIVIADSAVRANDGLGTNVLTAKQSASVVIGQPAQVPPAPVVTTAALPAKPSITSSTHPQQDMWYSGGTATFSWNIPSDITSIRTLLGTSPSSVPTISYDNSVSQKTISNLEDGVLYFHLRFANSAGLGPVAHYRIQIDSTAPEAFTPTVQVPGTQALVTLNASDSLSGIDSYALRVDDNAALRVKYDTLGLTNNIYTLPVLAKGDHTLVVSAYDKAGNRTDSTVAFTAPAIKAPEITEYPLEVVKGDHMTVSGKSLYPKTRVEVYVQPEGREAVMNDALTGADGSFTVTASESKITGTSAVWAKLVFTDGVESEASDKLFVKVVDTKFKRTASAVTYGLSVIIPVVALLILLLCVLYVGWHKFFGLKRRVVREVRGATEDVHKAFMLFRDELNRQLSILEGTKEDRALNRKEEKIFKELQRNVDTIDEFIQKKLKKIK